MVLAVGDNAPNFSFIDDDGQKKDFHSIEGKKIVFFFPRAFTPGCTAEACSIRDTYQDLKQAGVSKIIGVSTDNEEKQKSFIEKYNLNYTLVSDKTNEISKNFGVFTKKFFIVKLSDRFTFVIDENNKIETVFKNGISGHGSKYGLKKHGIEILESFQQ